MRLWTLLVPLAGLAAYAQQLPFNKYDYGTLGLSTACVVALNTTVECSDLLGAQAGQVDVVFDPYDEEELEAVCSDQCRSDLERLRTTIQAACDPDTDVMHWDDLAFPATFNLDRYLHTMDVACTVDSETGMFCDLLVAQWRNDTNATDENACHECILEPWRLQLESPIGYDEEFAEDFSLATQSCGVAGYSYSTPPVYGTPVNPSSTSTSSTATAVPPSCATPYTVSEGDTCESIAVAHNISNYGIVETNDLDIDCHLLVSRKQICLPSQCRTHTMMINDNCKSLERQYGVTRPQLVSWNGNFDAQCLFIERWRYTTVCVSPPGANLDAEPVPEPSQGPTPPNAHPGSNTRCASWYTVVEGDYCDKIANEASLTNKDFYFLNQGLDESCTNLELGTAYCVTPVGDITTYPGYVVEGPSTSFTRPPTTTSEVIIPTKTIHPHASDTIDSCATYANAVDTRALVKFFGSRPWYAEANQCGSFAGDYHVSIDELLEWNPSLSESNCVFEEGFSYCVVKYESTITTSAPPSTSTTATTTTTSTTTTSVEIPENTQPGTIDTCKKFHLVGADDGACDGIIALYGLSRSDFYEWNPDVGDNCTALWLGYYVCIGV